MPDDKAQRRTSTDKKKVGRRALLCLGLLGAVFGTHVGWTATLSDPLPSWNAGDAKQAIVAFVEHVTDAAGPRYVPEPQRIAVFDNDGTLWAEQPVYFELAFSFDRVHELASRHPEWRTTEPFRAILSNDRARLAKMSRREIEPLVAATHAGMTEDAFEETAHRWLEQARHPRLERRYVDCVYQPQLELLSYLQGNGFKTFIVTGGDVGFVRAFAEKVYRIPPEQVIGSSVKYAFKLVGGRGEIERLPAMNSFDDGPAKPANIALHIGRRPILAFGNSDGDRQMLEYTDTGSGAHLILLLHHDDGKREWAYDRNSAFGRLDKALDEARQRRWVIVSMKNDFQSIFPPLK